MRRAEEDHPLVTPTTRPVLDPTLPRWRRRWFHQPASGPGHRAFTMAGAALGPSRMSVAWTAARDRETEARRGRVWF